MQFTRCCNLIGWLRILSWSHENLADLPRCIFPSLPLPTFARACAYAEKYGWLARLVNAYVNVKALRHCTKACILNVLNIVGLSEVLVTRSFSYLFYALLTCIMLVVW